MNTRQIEEMVQRAGLSLISPIERKRHFKARLRANDGRECTQIFPCSVSDHRGLLNKEAQLRRFARNFH